LIQLKREGLELSLDPLQEAKKKNRIDNGGRDLEINYTRNNTKLDKEQSEARD
jgi:hypothetical protein